MRYLVLLLAAWPVFCQGFNLQTRKLCCTLGTNYSTNGQECKAFQPPIPGVSALDERACINTIDICCKKQLRVVQCNLGIEDAKSASCVKQLGDRADCCDACLFGIEAKKAGDECDDLLGLGSPSSEALTKCCEEFVEKTQKVEPTTSTTVKPFPELEATVSAESLKYSKSSDELYPGLSEENVCETGEFCAQLCIPSGKTFKCSCFPGYQLMKDEVSCKPIKRAKGSRCEQNNPCDHDCIDTGISVECSCRKGFELAPDNKSCKDLDECALGRHDCAPNEECENDEGTYFCFITELETDDEGFSKCPIGLKFNSEKSVCDDINECEMPLICNPPKVCKNTIGSFTCEGPDCPPGFYFKASIESCADIDECVTGDNDCNKDSQLCVNTKGNYTCVDKASRKACPPGFKKNELSLFCEDINECEGSLQVCQIDELCINEEGGYKCVALKPSTNQFHNNYQPSTTPKATPPPTCPKGFKFNFVQNSCEDINECQLRIDNCSPMHRCDNTIGSFYCTRPVSCGTGYTLNSASDLCEDDDECALGTHNCFELGPNFVCNNQMGSYRCEVNRPVYRAPSSTTTTTKLPPVTVPKMTTPRPPTTTTTTATTRTSTTTVPSPTSTLKPISITNIWGEPFYSGNRKQWWYPYLPKQTSFYNFPSNPSTNEAINTPPVYENPFNAYHRTTTTSLPIINGMLKKCLPGYKMNSRGDCEDIDECQSNPCPRGSKCLNFNGRFQCSSPLHCKIGYEANEAGNECIDVDECATGTHNCSKSQICKNGHGYYTCECPPGHHLNRLTQVCEDLDECKFYRPCGNYADCTNTVGSYQCSCTTGFKMQQNICQDIDECQETPGLCQERCINTWGSYRCGCKPGFTLNQDNRTCTDINECEKFKDRKLCIGTCVNVPGSYTCQCPKGYKLGTDKRVCIDIDECQHNVCGPQDACVNTRGGYKCYLITCSPNYIKDPNHKSRCKRLTCDPRDNQCLLMPEQYSYQYIALVSNLPLDEGGIPLFKMKGPDWSAAKSTFSLKLQEVHCPPNVECINESFIRKINPEKNLMELSLVRNIQGPQEVKLQVEMKLFQGENNLIGSVVVYLIIVVSEYPF